MKTQPVVVVDHFEPARAQFESMLAQVRAPAAVNWTHSAVEEFLHSQGNEALRLAYQGVLDAHTQADQLRAHAQPMRTGAIIHSVARPIESLFCRVQPRKPTERSTLIQCGPNRHVRTTKGWRW